MADAVVDRANILNINVGVLGHVDSGKTSLVKALSTSLSTAALDKNPQSQARGITLDLGFSAFTVPLPERVRQQMEQAEERSGEQRQVYDLLQVTLVDCPGHASLIRTIIGGAQIIDMMILVVDTNKGIQTQTAECIVIGEITTDKLIIVLNKVDAIPEEDREAKLLKVEQRLRKVFSTTKFANAPIVRTAAAVGGEKVASVGAATHAKASKHSHRDGTDAPAALGTLGIDKLVRTIQELVDLPDRSTGAGQFYFAIDHCFPIKGHGTVLTGTVLNGCVGVNDSIEIPHLQIQKKVKRMQIFRKAVGSARKGDRLGICVTNLDPKMVERGVAAAPGSVPLLSTVICMVKKVRFFKPSCRSNSKFHITIGHTTVIANVTFFGASELSGLLGLSKAAVGCGGAEAAEVDYSAYDIERDFNSDAPAAAEGATAAESAPAAALSACYTRGFPDVAFDWDAEYQQQTELAYTDGLVYGKEVVQWALLQLQQPVFCPLGSLVIGSRLDADSSEGSSFAHQCRLAFYGPVRHSIVEEEAARIRIYGWRSKEAQVYRLLDVRGGLCYECIGYKLVQESGNVAAFAGMCISTESGERGLIVGAFGAGGRFKVRFVQGARVAQGAKLVLRFKRFAGDRSKGMVQTGAGFDGWAGEGVQETRPVMGDESRASGGDGGRVAGNSKSSAATTTVATTVAATSSSQSRSAEGTASVIAAAAGDVRRGTIESVKRDPAQAGFNVCVVSGAFRMEEDVRRYAGSECYGPQGVRGRLLGPFAKMGKCKVALPDADSYHPGEEVSIELVDAV